MSISGLSVRQLNRNNTKGRRAHASRLEKIERLYKTDELVVSFDGMHQE